MSARCAESSLRELARQAGLAPVWQDIHGRRHQVTSATLRALLATLGLACESPAQIADSQKLLRAQAYGNGPDAVFTDVGVPATFRHEGSLHYTLTLENGERSSGTALRAGTGTIAVSAPDVPGYHDLSIGNRQLRLVVAPARCLPLPASRGTPTRCWGIAAQVYSLRRNPAALPPDVGESEDARGAGDYGALGHFARQAGEHGANALAISPVHALFSADPQRYGPYAPSSRLFLNTAYIDAAVALGPEAVTRAMSASDMAVGIVPDGGRPPALIDWPRVARARLRLFSRIFQQFDCDGDSAHALAFRQFRAAGGKALEHHARYEALHARFATTLGPDAGWAQWPGEFHEPDGPAVLAYAARHESEIRFHMFLQWLADKGMRFAQRSARESGMSIGLITDLAIGTDGRGSHAWSERDNMLSGISVGAAPDMYQREGQNWGLTAFSPRALRQKSYDPFIRTLRAALAHAGGVRIDHVLGLSRMWLIPQGAKAEEGVYLHYPMDDMLRILSLESWRHHAIMIGENLGTVPEGFNERLYARGVLGTSVLWFQRQPARPRVATQASGAKPDDSQLRDTPHVDPFLAPAQWPPQAMATPSTHDLPTIAGWWAGRDLQWRHTSGQITAEELVALAQVRESDKRALWEALRAAGCIPAHGPWAPTQAPREAILSFVASTPAPLVMVPIEDFLGLMEQPNLPGSDASAAARHPNWIQRLPRDSSSLFADPGVRGCIAAVAAARSRP